jgi:hypothetical protein
MRLLQSLTFPVFGAAAIAQTPVPFPQTPSHQTDLPGVTTGGEFADLDRDGWPDLVVANGNDILRQRVAVYRNRGNGVFPVNPDWQSADVDYHGHLDVGDVNGDGWPDVAVSVYLGAGGFGTPGRVKLYLNNGAGTLGSNPAWISGDTVNTFSCALGDVDGDGDLDLAVAAGEPYQGAAVRDRVYPNQGGTLASLPGWTSTTPGYAMDIGWGDIDGDGDLDLVTAGARGGNRLYRNDGGVLTGAPVWTSSDGGSSHNGNTAVLGDVDGDGRPDLVVADNDQLGGTGTFRVYRNLGTTFTATPWWQSAVFHNGYTSAVNLLDFDLDGDLDLVAGGWWTQTAWYRNTGTGLPAVPTWETTGTSVVEALFFADVNRDGVRTVLGEAPAVNGARRLFAFARRPVESLQQVVADNVALAPSQYAFHRATGTLSLAQAPQASLRLDYTYSEATDLGVTNWDQTLGNYVFVRRPLVGVTMVPPPRTDFRAGEVIAWTETIASTAMNWQPAWYLSELFFPGATSGLPMLSLGADLPPAFALPALWMYLGVPNPLSPSLLGDYSYRVRAFGPAGILMSNAQFAFRLVL